MTTNRKQRAVYEMRAFVELFALCGFAITQPVLDVFGNAPSEFVFRSADTTDIVAFGLLVTVLPAGVLWVAEAAIGLVSATARRWTHVAFLAILAALFTLQLIKDVTDVRGLLLGILALVAVTGFGWLYLRVAATRTWLAFAAVAPLLFLGLFLFSSPVSELLGGNEAEAAQLGNVENPAPVVLVVLDEFPLTALIDADGGLDAELYPNFGRFADEGTWYRNATAVTQYTELSVPAILTGRYPEGQGLPLASDHPENIFTLLGNSYDLAVSETTTRLCPSNLCASDAGSAGTSGGLRALLGDARSMWRTQIGLEDSDADPTAAFADDVDTESRAAVAEAAADEQDLPTLVDEAAVPQPERFEFLLDAAVEPGAHLTYLHMLLPHVPYQYLPDGRVYPASNPQPGRDADELSGSWVGDAAPVDLSRQRELLQVRYVDALMGELIDTMEEAGTWDDALVIVTSDHGSAFIPGESPRGSALEDIPEELYPQIAWVPLFVHYPGQSSSEPTAQDSGVPPAGEISDSNVESVDIVPTVADVLGVEIPWSVDGLSMLDTDARPTDEKVFFEARWFGQMDAGNRVEFDGAELFPEVLAQGVDSLLPAVGDPLRSYRIVPGVELVGKSVDEGAAPVTSTADGVTFSLDQDLLDGDVQPDAGSVPVYLSGHLEGATRTETVAVALNGRVGGVTSTYAWDGHDSFFAVMLPPEFLVAGPNDVELFLVRDGGLVALSPPDA